MQNNIFKNLEFLTVMQSDFSVFWDLKIKITYISN